MVAAANMVEVAALVGDTARATMLAALMGGRSLTGSELAFLARISRPTESEHLNKLVAARLIAVTKKRRYCYYRIASPRVASMLQSMKAVAAIDVPARYTPRSAQDEVLRFVRTCYDHLAGQLAVAIADALASRGHVILTEDGGEVTDAGATFFTGFGAELMRPRSKRIFCRPCLDWSERRYLCWSGRLRDLRAMHRTGLAGPRARHAGFAPHVARAKRAVRGIWFGSGPA